MNNYFKPLILALTLINSANSFATVFKIRGASSVKTVAIRKDQSVSRGKVLCNSKAYPDAFNALKRSAKKRCGRSPNKFAPTITYGKPGIKYIRQNIIISCKAIVNAEVICVGREGDFDDNDDPLVFEDLEFEEDDTF